MFNGYEKWPVDVQKCTSMRVGNQKGVRLRHLHQGLSLEQALHAPPPLGKLGGEKIRLRPEHGHLGDGLMGYGKPHPERAMVARPRRGGRRGESPHKHAGRDLWVGDLRTPFSLNKSVIL